MRERAARYWDKRGGRGDHKESELGMATSLLTRSELRDKEVTGDAPYCQQELSLRVLEQGGDYFWVLKDNQPGVRETMSLLFAEPPWGKSLATATREARRGDRWERRGLWASAVLNGYLERPGLGQVYCVKRRRRRKGSETVERVYAITSLPVEQADPLRMLDPWTGHWSIENRVFWIRDVTMDEDRCRIISGSPPQMMAALHNVVMSLFRMGIEPNIAPALHH